MNCILLLPHFTNEETETQTLYKVKQQVSGKLRWELRQAGFKLTSLGCCRSISRDFLNLLI